MRINAIAALGFSARSNDRAGDVVVRTRLQTSSHRDKQSPHHQTTRSPVNVCAYSTFRLTILCTGNYGDAGSRQLVALGAGVAWSHVALPGPTPPGVRSTVRVPLAQLVANSVTRCPFHWMLWGEDVPRFVLHSMGLPVTVRVHT